MEATKSNAVVRGGIQKKLKPSQVEVIWLLTGLGKSPLDIAEVLGITRRVVAKYLRQGRQDTALADRIDWYRSQIARAFSGHLQRRGLEVFNTIKDDEILAMKPPQRAVVAGIMLDKAAVLETKARLTAPQASLGELQLPSPTDIAGLVESIKNRMARLTIMQVEVPLPLKAKVTEALDVMEEAEIVLSETKQSA